MYWLTWGFASDMLLLTTCRLFLILLRLLRFHGAAQSRGERPLRLSVFGEGPPWWSLVWYALVLPTLELLLCITPAPVVGRMGWFAILQLTVAAYVFRCFCGSTVLAWSKYAIILCTHLRLGLPSLTTSGSLAIRATCVSSFPMNRHTNVFLIAHYIFRRLQTVMIRSEISILWVQIL
jgi:hypothetical protein